MSKIAIGLLFVSLLIASSCQSDSIIANGNCIKSFESYAYVFPEEEHSEAIPPLPPWEIVASIPQSAGSQPQVSIARKVNEQNGIWVRRFCNFYSTNI